MIKLITPPGMLLTVALLVIYSVYAFQIGSIEKSWALLAGSGIAVVASYGAAMLRPWSQYLVYLLTLGFIVKLGHSIYAGIASGYFAFQFGSLSESLKALIPSTTMVLLSCVCCLIVFRHFRNARKIPVGTTAQASSNETVP